MPVQFNLPPMLLLGPLLAAVAVYGVLRWVIWAPRTGTSPATVSEHALWVGVIGWLASSLQGAMNLGIIPATPYPGPALTSAGQIFPALAWPVLGCLGVHALGQVSYPGPRRLRRQAVLSVRRIRDFLPRRLALAAAIVFAAAGACIVWTATLPGFASVAPVNRQDGPDNYYQSGGRDGRIPGAEVAGWLGGALLVLAAGTCLVLWQISRRRQLESLDAADNAALRTIAMNRLLRTVSTVAAGLGVIAGNFAARPDPSAETTSWTNPAGIAGAAVLLAMWWWRPPRLAAAGLGARNRPESGLAVGRRHPAVRLVSSLGALLGLAAAVPLVAGVFLSPVLMAVAGLGLAGVVALMAGLVLLVIAAGELLLQRNYGTPEEPRELAPAAGEPCPADHRGPGAACVRGGPRRHSAGAGPAGRGAGLDSRGAAHGRYWRHLAAGVPGHPAPPVRARPSRRHGRRPARHHHPPDGPDPRRCAGRPGRDPVADAHTGLGGRARAGGVPGNRPRRRALVAGVAGRRRPGLRRHSHRRDTRPNDGLDAGHTGSAAGQRAFRVTAGISVNLHSATPPYEQIRAQITSLIKVGALAPGTRLPTVRSLAADLGIAAGTVARAYKELEQSGLIETRRRNGTVVAGMPAPSAATRMPAGVGAEVIAAVDRYIRAGREAGLDDAALLAILRTKLSQQDE